jgi:hypothetical protein
MPQDGCEAPHDTALFAMTANRLARPASTWACEARGLADEGCWPEAKPLALDHLYRALDFVLGHIASREQELFFRTAAGLNAAGARIFWDTTTLSFASADEDDAGDVGHDQALPARRQRGHHQEGREGNPQVVVGRALTREGWPVRAWVLPGHTADVTAEPPSQG